MVHRSCSARCRIAIVAVALASAVGPGLAACGSDGGTGPEGSGSAASVHVVASFYPLQWVTERIGGDAVEVDGLTPPGAEPHDIELTPRAVAGLADADLVVFLSDFQPAVDDAIGGSEVRGFDVADAASLDLVGGDHDHDHDHEGDGDGEDGHDEADHEEADHDEEGAVDPHFWLDPLRLADVGDAIADQLAEVVPPHAAAFAERAAELRSDLEALDGEYEAGLETCESRDLVTSHAAFGYLAERYLLAQHGITGLSPTAEPSPADLAEAVDFVQEHDVRTIYFETLVSPAVARTLADEVGVQTAALDPIEGLTDASKGTDYLEVMRSNLVALRDGQVCS